LENRKFRKVTFMNLLFDLDGTLANAMDAFCASIDHAFDFYGLARPDYKTKCSMLGPPLRDELPKVVGQSRLSLVQGLIEKFREHHGKEGIYLYKFFDGMEDAVTNLRNQGYRTFVATSKPKVYADEIFRFCKKRDLFDGIYGSELSGANSKKGEVIGLAIRENNLEPQKTLMVGDRMHDVLGAKEHGLRVVGVTWGYGCYDELRSAGADQIVDTWAQLMTEIILWAADQAELTKPSP
jgi:phosphoglycolate phosphatase